MRELTQEEIDLAPEGYDTFLISALGTITVIDKIKMLGIRINKGSNKPFSINKECYAYTAAKPIPRKALDISGHEFSKGSDIEQAEITEEKELLLQLSWQPSALNKDDAIAIAKALGVTGGDL